MSVIALILIAVTVGIIGSLVISAFASLRTNNCSRVDWSKVLFVFLGLPALLLIALGGTYALMNVRTQQMAHAAEKEMQAAMHAARLAEESAKIRQRSERHISGQVRIGSADDFDSNIVPESDSASVHEESSALAVEHHIPSVTGKFVEAVSTPSLNWLTAGMVIPFCLVMCITAFGAKRSRKALLGAAFAIAIGAILIVRTSDFQRPAFGFDTSAEPDFVVSVEPDVVIEQVGAIPVGQDEGEKLTPISVRESRYDYRNGKSVTRKILSKIPRWAEEAMSETVVRPDENEIVITSKRYSSVQEAETELKQIAETMVTDYMAGLYPEMRESWVTAEEMMRLGVLEHSCEITWPFQVGEFSDEVYQVAWQLDVTRRIQEQLHSNWQRGQLTHRLALVGGGFALVTFIFGFGAVVTRGKEQNIS